jgi:hypothetical protein
VNIVLQHAAALRLPFNALYRTAGLRAMFTMVCFRALDGYWWFMPLPLGSYHRTLPPFRDVNAFCSAVGRGLDITLPRTLPFTLVATPLVRISFCCTFTVHYAHTLLWFTVALSTRWFTRVTVATVVLRYDYHYFAPRCAACGLRCRTVGLRFYCGLVV